MQILLIGYYLSKSYHERKERSWSFAPLGNCKQACISSLRFCYIIDFVRGVNSNMLCCHSSFSAPVLRRVPRHICSASRNRIQGQACFCRLNPGTGPWTVVHISQTFLVAFDRKPLLPICFENNIQNHHNSVLENLFTFIILSSFSYIRIPCNYLYDTI